MFRVTLTLGSVLAAAVFAPGQGPSGAAKQRAACGVVEKGYGQTQRPPVVYGKPYDAPGLRLRVTDERTGAPVAGREVFVRYVWRWFEYPYPERPFGVWSEAFDLVKCVSDARGVVEMSGLKVTPGGWYRGKMLLGRKPEFTHLDVSVHFETHVTHVRITKGELERYRKSKADDIPLRVPPAPPPSK